MYLTEQEILDTPNALKRTVAYFEEQKDALKAFFAKNPQKKFTFFGCGSSFMLSKSAAALFNSIAGTTACAVPAGDYIVEPAYWAEAVRGSIVVSLSRSGRTSEMVRAVKHVKETLGCPVLSLSMENGNDIMPMSDFDLTMDWCYDKSVCQTRTVANLYAMTLLVAAAYADNAKLAEAVKAVAEKLADFQLGNMATLETLANKDWTSAVVLADGAVCGIAEEGALAFTEIAMLTGRYFHVLDYRHGPIVISGPSTITLMLLNPAEEALQAAMVQDVKKHGGIVVTVSDKAGNPYQATEHIQIEGIAEFAAVGIPFIYLAQMLAFKKAIALGGNPDAPTGLDAYITLA